MQLIAKVPSIGGNLRERQIPYVAASPHHQDKTDMAVFNWSVSNACVSDCWHMCWQGQGGSPSSYLVPKVGAGCNPVELLVGI